MVSSIPMSVAFLSATEEARVSKAAVLRQQHFFPDDADGVPRLVRLAPRISWTIWLAQLADGRALVQAGAQIDVGYEVFLPNPDAPGFLDAARIVTSIDRTTREATKEWLITWDVSQTSAPADAPLVQAQLAPEWFAQPLLRWIHETAGTGDAAVDLAGFAEHDVPLELGHHAGRPARLRQAGHRRLLRRDGHRHLDRARRRRRRASGRHPRRPPAAHPGVAPGNDHLARRP